MRSGVCGLKFKSWVGRAILLVAISKSGECVQLRWALHYAIVVACFALCNSVQLWWPALHTVHLWRPALHCAIVVGFALCNCVQLWWAALKCGAWLLCCFKFKSRLDQLSGSQWTHSEPHLTVLDGGLPCLTSFLILFFPSLLLKKKESETNVSSLLAHIWPYSVSPCF